MDTDKSFVFDEQGHKLAKQGVLLNPGTGPVEGADYQNAIVCMVNLCEDVRKALPAGWSVTFDRTDKEADDGRFPFPLTVVSPDGKVFEHEVDMPGLPVAEVRYVDRGSQDIWDFPRLYVDGSSWVWLYAVSVMADDADEQKADDVEPTA